MSTSPTDLRKVLLTVVPVASMYMLVTMALWRRSRMVEWRGKGKKGMDRMTITIGIMI